MCFFQKEYFSYYCCMGIIDRLFPSNKSKEEQFWDWFVSRSTDYLELTKDRDELFDELEDKLGKVHDNIVFVFSGERINGTREFIISADGIKEVFPSVIKLVDAAPQIPNFEIIAFRQPSTQPVNEIGIRMGDFDLHGSDMFFRYADDDRKLGVELNVRDLEEGNTDQIQMIFILLDAILGEYDVEMYIGWIDIKVLNEDEVGILLPIEELPKVLAAKKLEWQN